VTSICPRRSPRCASASPSSRPYFQRTNTLCVEGNKSKGQFRAGDQRIEQRSHRRWDSKVIVYIELISYSGYLIKKSYQKLAKEIMTKEIMKGTYPSNPTKQERNSAKNLPTNLPTRNTYSTAHAAPAPCGASPCAAPLSAAHPCAKPPFAAPRPDACAPPPAAAPCAQRHP
jgi:hypothetical protein